MARKNPKRPKPGGRETYKYRSAKTGRYVTKKYATRHKSTTVRESSGRTKRKKQK